MASWSLLPTDILDIIFEDVLEFDSYIRYYPRLNENIRSCQQTCKSWAVVAQMHVYKYVDLYSFDRLELFIHSLRNYNIGSLVKNIALHSIKRSRNREELSSLIQQIGYFCQNLKILESTSGSSKVVWKCIQIERSKGAFSKLQVISPPCIKSDRLIKQYYEVAYTLRETLCELTLYVGKSAPIENLEFFTDIDTLYFKLDKCTDIYTALDQQCKCSSVEVINIKVISKKIDEEYLLMRDAKIISSVRICPQVKQLSVRDIAIDSKLCGYLMNVFPNLNKLVLFKFSMIRSQRLDRVPNNTAHRFLSYLMKMSSAKVGYLPVEDVEDLLMNFHDINGMNKHLSISYKRERVSSISLEISTKQEIGIEVMNLDGRELFYLPRLGMIEKSGEKFRSLTLDMNWLRLKSGFDISYNGTDLYHILFYCPNMKNICIMNALLPCFSTHEHQRLRLSLQTFKIDRCEFGTLYLCDLSFHVNYINALTIREDTFFKSRVINMPETEFYSINYFQGNRFRHIFLKLEKTVDDSVGWYASDYNKIERCTEEYFEASSYDNYTMSIFIRCVDVRIIELRTTKIKVTLKT